MKGIKLWKIKKDAEQSYCVDEIQDVNETETENQLEEVITKCPDLLMKDLTLVGRQTETPGGPMDLLGVDSDGRLVVFELKRGTLTREAVAQIIDYSSYLASLEPEELSNHITERSGSRGIEKIDNFLSWYQEQFGTAITDKQRPAMVLVGLGADERTTRMVSFLSEGDLDISLITFHGFKQDGETYLAKQVEVSAKTPVIAASYSKESNLKKLKAKVQELGVEEYYYEISAFFRNQFPAAYEWPNPGGYAYALPELTETGRLSNRVYASLYLQDAKPNWVQIYLHPRAIEAASEDFRSFADSLGNRLLKRQYGSCDLWVKSKSDWNSLKSKFEEFCPAILAGWKRKKEQQSKEEFESAEVEKSGGDSSGA